jgi:uncharacterized protein YbjT (DUF2867 family)
MRLLLFGGTGLVGSHVLDRALADPRIAAVVAPVRRAQPARLKLLAPVVDFEHLPEDAEWWPADAVISALGTTMRRAGSKPAFRRVDYDYQLGIARLAKAQGTPTFVLNSAMGADASSPFFYMRVKGELERDVGALGFRSLTILRPGLIGGTRDEARPAEQVASILLGALRPLLPRSLRINPAGTIAARMLDAALAGRPGRHVVRSAELT